MYYSLCSNTVYGKTEPVIRLAADIPRIISAVNLFMHTILMCGPITGLREFSGMLNS